MPKSNKIDVYSLIFGGLISLIAQGIWNIAFDYANGNVLDEFIGISLAFVVAGVVLNVFVFRWLRGMLKKNTEKPNEDNEGEWKITIKNGDKTLEATGMDGDTVQKILESWNKNINPNNPDPNEKHLDK
jgi:hypothetical protein